MKRRSATAWVKNNIIGELVPPELDYLINRLQQINSAAPVSMIVEHARKIHTAYQLLRGRPDDHGFKIKGKKRSRAERVAATRGLKDDLLRLLKAAQGGSAKEWQSAYLGVSGTARTAIAPPAPAVLERQLDPTGKLTGFRRARVSMINMRLVKVAGLSVVSPNAKDAIPRIKAALEECNFSSKRQADKLTNIFVLRVRDAYRALAGKKGLTYRSLVDDSTLNPKGGFVEAGLVALARDIDRQFGTKVVTIRRLRKKDAELGLSPEELENLRKPWGERTS
jgi:hypothetical protein